MLYNKTSLNNNYDNISTLTNNENKGDHFLIDII